MIVEIATLEDERLDVYARLTETQLRSKLEPEKAIFIAESGKVIERAFAGGMEPLSLLMEAKWLAPLQPLIDSITQRFPEIPVFVAPHNELKKLTGFELTRGALGAFRRPALPSVADVVAGARRIAVLEDITNHTNVGAIFRSAAALDMDAVLVTPNCYDPFYRRAVRVSMGTVFQIPWTRIGMQEHEARSDTKQDDDAWEGDTRGHTRQDDDAWRGNAQGCTRRDDNAWRDNVQGCTKRDDGAQRNEAYDRQSIGKSAQPGNWAESGIPLLHSFGFKTAALALSDDSISLDDPQLAAEEKLALILGTEGDGLAAQTIARCDYTVRIPMSHGVDSLNVAAASAVAFWELRAR